MRALSGGTWRAERVQPCECGGELIGPGPVAVQAQAQAAGVTGDLGGDVPEAVAQRLGFGAREVTGQQQLLRQASRSCASWVSSSQTSLQAKD